MPGYKPNNKFYPNIYPNPIISGSPGSSSQFYPPTWIKMGNTYYVIAKSGGDLYGFSSTNINSWGSGSLVLENSSSGWDSIKLEYSLLRYNPDDLTYYLFYSGYDGSNFTMGYATSLSPLSGYTKQGQIYTHIQYNDEFVGSHNNARSIHITEILKIDSVYYFFGVADLLNDAGTGIEKSALFVCTGNTMTNPEWVADIRVMPTDHPGEDWFQSPAVFQYNNQLYMSVTVGIANNQLNERRVVIYHNPTNTPTSGWIYRDEILIPSGASGSWNERRSYNAQFLKEQDGNYLNLQLDENRYRMLFSGHNLTGNPSPNQGLTGLLEFFRIPNY